MSANTEDGMETMTSSLTLSAISDIQRLNVPSRLTAEEELLLAVLEDAIVCFQKHAFAKDQREKELFLDAEAWIMSDASNGLFCFVTVCELLGVAPSYVRQGLMSWKKQLVGKRMRGIGLKKKAA